MPRRDRDRTSAEIEQRPALCSVGLLQTEGFNREKACLGVGSSSRLWGKGTMNEKQQAVGSTSEANDRSPV